jgi:hypothetical protein
MRAIGTRLALLMVVLLLGGCAVGYNSALFVTRSNVGIDFESTPPTAEISVSRQEGVLAPVFERGQTPPLLAGFATESTGLGSIPFGGRSVFAGGAAAVALADTAQAYKSPDDTLTNKSGNAQANQSGNAQANQSGNAQANKSGNAQTNQSDDAQTNQPDKTLADKVTQALCGSRLCLSKEPTQPNLPCQLKNVDAHIPGPGEYSPMILVSDTTLGAKVVWTGATATVPSRLLVGYNRIEIVAAPVFGSSKDDCPSAGNNCECAYSVWLPPFLAVLDTTLGAVSSPAPANFCYSQIIATGRSAIDLGLNTAVGGIVGDMAIGQAPKPGANSSQSKQPSPGGTQPTKPPTTGSPSP